MKFKTLFIINPISGGKEKSALPQQILRYLQVEKFEASFQFTTEIGHASVLAKAAVASDYDIIVGVGGDGTLNEVASEVVHSSKILGIIPFGSGNGLARELGIPMNLIDSIKCLNSVVIKIIDAVTMNDKYFFNMAGMGFDAQISDAFKQNKRRGFWEYLKLCIREFNHFKPGHYQIEIDGQLINHQAFLISIANSSQYGNNIYISPDSSLTDGKIEMVLVDRLNWFELIQLGVLMGLKQTKRFKKLHTYSGKVIQITRSSQGVVHLDGEPLQYPSALKVQIKPQALRVIIGPGFKL